MDELIAQLQRLYPAGLPDAPAATLGTMLTGEGEGEPSIDLVGPGGQVCALVIELDSGFWTQAAQLYEGVQTELDLPAPAVSVSGSKAYGLWFSFATAVPLARAEAFAEGLRLRFLAEVPATRLSVHPRAPLKRVPAHLGDGRWSAYIDASLGSMFIDEPWLEMAPSPHKQAELLAGLASIKPDVFDRALGILQAAAAGAVVHAPTGEAKAGHEEPFGFLLAIMNDDAVETSLRIEAAKALLPYFRKAPD